MENLLTENRLVLMTAFADGLAEAIVKAVEENPDPDGALTPIAPLAQKWLDGDTLTDLEVSVTLYQYTAYKAMVEAKHFKNFMAEAGQLLGLGDLLEGLASMPVVPGPTRNN